MACAQAWRLACTEAESGCCEQAFAQPLLQKVEAVSYKPLPAKCHPLSAVKTKLCILRLRGDYTFKDALCFFPTDFHGHQPLLSEEALCLSLAESTSHCTLSHSPKQWTIDSCCCKQSFEAAMGMSIGHQQHLDRCAMDRKGKHERAGVRG